MADLPLAFLEKMQRLLGDEYPAFLESYAWPSGAGLRANTLKIEAAGLVERLPYRLEGLPWCPAGFRLLDDPDAAVTLAPGKHPYHAAGLYYLQEPSAMAVAEVLQPQPGERILDLCAAPGGKATHLAALMQGQGLLVANEIHPRRVWDLAENLERWGARHANILNESPERLVEYFSGFFDRVLVDAPCSGEGMFRLSRASQREKGEIARQEWSSELAASCALRQAGILDDAAQLVRPGGWLAYSTCTFNPDENESVIAGLLARWPEFEPVEISGFAPGRPEWAAPHSGPPGLSRAARLWPHRLHGEGHFVALLRRREVPGAPGNSPIAVQRSGRPAGKKSAPSLQPFYEFRQAHLQEGFQDGLEGGRLNLHGSYVYWTPPVAPDLAGLKVIHPGWWLGTLKTGQRQVRFEPSHALALGLRPGQALQALQLGLEDPALPAYLRGETLENAGPDGWLLVTVDGHGLGWGKRSQGRVKNYYPKGLRQV